MTMTLKEETKSIRTGMIVKTPKEETEKAKATTQKITKIRREQEVLLEGIDPIEMTEYQRSDYSTDRRKDSSRREPSPDRREYAPERRSRWDYSPERRRERSRREYTPEKGRRYPGQER